MTNKKNNDVNPFDDKKSEEIEEYTLYDEFIPSFHFWIPSEVQKRKARQLEIED